MGVPPTARLRLLLRHRLRLPIRCTASDRLTVTFHPRTPGDDCHGGVGTNSGNLSQRSDCCKSGQYLACPEPPCSDYTTENTTEVFHTTHLRRCSHRPPCEGAS